MDESLPKPLDLQRLIAASNVLKEHLIASPMWPLLQSEPVIVEWTTALYNLEAQLLAMMSSHHEKLQ